VLEERVIPLFYTRDEQGVPLEWVAMQKHALATLAGPFSAHRMVKEYAERFYYPCADRYNRLRRDNGAAVRGLIGWERSVAGRWRDVAVTDVHADAPERLEVGATIPVTAKVALGGLTPADLLVEAYAGAIDEAGQIVDGTPFQLEAAGVEGGTALYRGTATMARAGRVGLTVRVMPRHPDLAGTAATGLVRWA
jgi:starch phosphorylase